MEATQTESGECPVAAQRCDIDITIITSTLNCREALSRTIESIRCQSHSGTQWIIADGGSTDGTVELILESGDVVDDWLPGPDRGIYDAWNHACQRIRGQWVLFLGAGDVLCDARTLEKVSHACSTLPATVLVAYGNVLQCKDGQVIYRHGEVDMRRWQSYRPAIPPHQGSFHRAALLRVAAPFDDTYKIAADSKLLLQATRPDTTHYLGFDIADMEVGGMSAHPAQSITVMKEFLRIAKEVGYRFPMRQKVWFIFRSYLKFLTYRIAGIQAVSGVARLKRRIAQVIE